MRARRAGVSRHARRRLRRAGRRARGRVRRRCIALVGFCVDRARPAWAHATAATNPAVVGQRVAEALRATARDRLSRRRGPGRSRACSRCEGKELLERADVVVFDRLSAAAIVDMAPAQAERINVGKAPGPATTQDEINELLVGPRRQGADASCVSRAATRSCSGAAAKSARRSRPRVSPFEVVPGVTSASAAPAYAGVPLTHRGLSSSVTIVTGHDDAAHAWRGRLGRGGAHGNRRRHDRGVDGRARARARSRSKLIDGGMDRRYAGHGGHVGHAARAGHRAHHARRRWVTAEVKSPVTIVIGAVAALADDIALVPTAAEPTARVVIAAPIGRRRSSPASANVSPSAHRAPGAEVVPSASRARGSCPPTAAPPARRDRADARRGVDDLRVLGAPLKRSWRPGRTPSRSATCWSEWSAPRLPASFENAFERPADLWPIRPTVRASPPPIGEAPEDGTPDRVRHRRRRTDVPIWPTGCEAAGWDARSRGGVPPRAAAALRRFARDVVDGADAVVVHRRRRRRRSSSPTAG